MDKARLGIVGSGFVASIHAESIRKHAPEIEIVAVASPTKAERFAKEHSIPHAFTDYRSLIELPQVEIVLLAVPNDLHCQMAVDAFAAGKHVVCEKPLALNLSQADQMIEAGKNAKKHLFYAEELLFAPKYVRAKQLADSGALGDVFLVKQWEEHDGPHEPWFWDVSRSGGGVLMDMGCHSIEYGRWALGRPRVKSVSATLGIYVHREKTRGDDHSIVVIEYENGAVSVAENSWAKPGGVDDRVEIYGSKGNLRADLLRGSSILTFSEVGYDYAVEKAGRTQGWTFAIYEEAWNYGFPQEMSHFARCVRGLEEPIVTGEDGREVLKIIVAAYQSAREGRRIEWPYDPPAFERPIDLWLG
ncbi:MAG: Gfo/Idh/MocA family oxidoreductase [Armatimonadetes bacterium]|nr:Gfo/Idh/MocA family oxidoreductase [Armatimonadota bacterium]